MRLGIILSALLIILFIPIALLQWLAATTLISLVLSFIYVKLIDKYLIVERLDSTPRTFRLQATVIKIRLTNPLPIPLPYILVSDDSNGMHVIGERTKVFSLAAGESKIMKYNVKSERRGTFEIGPLHLLYSDPLGLFSKNPTLGREIPLLVLPKVYSLEMILSSGLPIGSIRLENKLYEDPGRYRSMREYVPGDDPRRINWMASAKNDKIQVMEYSSTMSAPLTAVLNINAEHYNPRSQYQSFERCIEIAGSVCQHWDYLDQEYSLIINSNRYNSIPKGKSHIAQALEILAGLEAPDRNCIDIAEILSGQKFGHSERIVVISPPILEREFNSWISMLPQNCFFEFWMLQDTALRENYINPSRMQTSKRVTIRSISNYGEGLFND